MIFNCHVESCHLLSCPIIIWILFCYVSTMLCKMERDNVCKAAQNFFAIIQFKMQEALTSSELNCCFEMGYFFFFWECLCERERVKDIGGLVDMSEHWLLIMRSKTPPQSHLLTHSPIIWVTPPTTTVIGDPLIYGWGQ